MSIRQGPWPPRARTATSVRSRQRAGGCQGSYGGQAGRPAKTRPRRQAGCNVVQVHADVTCDK